MIPQIIVIIFVAFKLGLHVKEYMKKDDATESSTSIAAAIIYFGIQLGVLYWGGFFDCFKS